MPNSVQGLPFGGQAPSWEDQLLSSLLKMGLKTGIKQGANYASNALGVPEWISGLGGELTGLLAPYLAPAAGTMAADLGLPTALAGIGAEGGGFGGAAGALGGGLGSEVGAALGLNAIGGLGFGLMGLPLLVGAFAPQSANSPTGFRPEGWSKYVTQRRTQQHHISDLADTYLQGLTNAAKGGKPAQGQQVDTFLANLSNPDNPINRNFFSVVDADRYNPHLKAQDTAQRVQGNLQTMFDTYAGGMSPVQRTQLAMTINSRDPNSHLAYDTLSQGDQGALSWEQKLRYQDMVDPGWRDRLAMANMTGGDPGINWTL